MNRKEFIKTCGIACLGTAALPSLLQSCAGTNYYAKANSSKDQIIIKKSEFSKPEKGKSHERKYILVKSEQYGFPICVYKLSNDNYSALLMECTHKSCELNPQDNFLVCPCHGSEFTNSGAVQNPPAEQNLKSFNTTSDNENIYIRL